MPDQPNQHIESPDLSFSSVAERHRLRVAERENRLIEGSRRAIAESKDMLAAADRLLQRQKIFV